MTEKRPIINEWVVVLEETWDLHPAAVAHIREGLCEAYDAGVVAATQDFAEALAGFLHNAWCAREPRKKK